MLWIATGPAVVMVMMIAVAIHNQENRRRLSRKYYEGIFRRMLEKAHAGFVRLPDFAPDATHVWQIKTVEQRISMVRDASVQLGPFITDEAYGTRLAEFTLATDELLGAIDFLLIVIAKMSSSDDRLQAAKNAIGKKGEVRRVAGELLLQLGR